MVLSLQHFALGVPDLKAGADFYTAFGLDMSEGQNDTLHFRAEGRPHDEVILIETGQKRAFQYISFGADEAGIKRIKQKLIDRGIQELDKPFDAAPAGIWFRDPDGALVNVHKTIPAILQADTAPLINHPGINNRVNQRGCPPFDTVAKPLRLGHMILFSPDVMKKAKFYCDVLEMKISDTIEGGYAAFLRTAANPSDHHVMGIIKSEGPGFHHASFEVASSDHIAIAARNLLGSDNKGGGRHAWGPGRHGVGSNFFHYFRDPWNGMAEYFYDIDVIDADYDWETMDWTKKDGMFLWSSDGMPPKDFGHNYELDD